jgi:hypothetical protein
MSGVPTDLVADSWVLDPGKCRMALRTAKSQPGIRDLQRPVLRQKATSSARYARRIF